MDGSTSAGPDGLQHALRRRDRLRALISPRTISRHGEGEVQSSRFSMPSIFRRRSSSRSTVDDLRQQAHSTRESLARARSAVASRRRGTSGIQNNPTRAPAPVRMQPMTVLEPLGSDDFADVDEAREPPVQETPPTAENRASRRFSLRLRGLVDPRLLVSRNRNVSTSNQPRSRISYHEPVPPDLYPPPVSTDRALDLSQSAGPSSESDYLHGYTPRRHYPRPANIYPRIRTQVEEERIRDEYVQRMRRDEERRSRRATWAPGAPLTRPSALNSSASNERLGENIGPASPTVIPPSSYQQLATTVDGVSNDSLTSTSPLSSLSSLFSPIASNQSSNSTATPESGDEVPSPATLRAGAARLATPMISNNFENNADAGVEQARERQLGRLGRLARAQSLIRRRFDTIRSRRDDDHPDLSELHRLIRSLGRPSTRASEGSDAEGEQNLDGMAPFTIVGIRRVDRRREGQDDDFLPPYIRDLVESATSSADNPADDTPQERQNSPRNGRPRRQRRILSFYDRMDISSREEVLQRLQRARPRSMFGSGSLRRNGVVEPDAASEEPQNEDPSPETYVIYLISGVLPENHPLLSAPSLFGDSPSYEDMLLIASLLGPAKPPVASESDVAAAPGLFVIEMIDDGKLVAVSRDSGDRVALLPIMEDGVERPERCLVCLSDYEAQEEARKLVNCGHLFHKDCIDQWLTEGRNSCPLCRGQGVEKKSSTSTLRASQQAEMSV